MKKDKAISALKRCGFCRELKPPSSYFLNRSRGDGREGLCKPCVRVRKEVWRSKNREKVRLLNRLSGKRNGLKRRKRRDFFPSQLFAQRVARRAINSGELIKKPCEKCGAVTSQAHHDSYLKSSWLKVRWLCPKHHREWHRQNEPILPKEESLLRDKLKITMPKFFGNQFIKN